MTIRVAVNHRTEYHYDRSVCLSPHVVRLRPAPHCRTRIDAYSLKVVPGKHFVNWQQDPFGNYLARLVFPEKTRELVLEVNLIAELTAVDPFDFFLEEYAEHFPFQYPPELRRDLAPYLETSEDGALLDSWLESVDRVPRRTVDFLVDINRRVQGDISYVIRLEHGVQTCEETLGAGIGSCRDSAWLLVQALRRMGLAARFVSGYLVQLTQDLPSLDGPSGPEEDFTDLHAWAEVYLPGAGWVGMDTTSGLFAGEGHVPLSCTPEPSSAAPVTGFTDPCEVRFVHQNRLRRIREDPRVTKPYTDEQWEAVTALGEALDRALEAEDVRVTFGGEPTFISIDDAQAAEWNTAALGAHKRERAEELLRSLWRRFAPGGVLHYGQGKWYPGEPLPRWADSIIWRRDAVAVWRHPELLAEPHRAAGYDAGDAERFAVRLTERLDLPAERAMPAYEDVYYHLWKEQSLPGNVDALDNRLEDPLERRRLVRLFERGLGAVVGYVLPLAPAPEGEGWVSDRWPLRRGRVFLGPGDSAMGYRLPLDSLPWEPARARQKVLPTDPFAPRQPFAETMQGARRARATPSAGHSDPAPGKASPVAVLRTALCVESREGRLHVFLPPLERAEAYLALLAAIESVAAELGQPVVLEGYPPPRDERLVLLQVTPDPGVIEVNIHPFASWRELVEGTAALYEEARLARLGTEKFMLDGRHCGTGGGNHVTIGGPTPAESPWLRRPDLLASLVLYWQNHPSLSYLFSGLFIGPTSQAPRVDEARDDALYELEIALAQLPAGEVQTPWLVDRLFRNLLVDVTGNTHRAEFCIDKLYSPDSADGRRGLLEFRGFEMPPHPQMSAVQMLLLRALLARFWRQPFRRAPVRWGTALHDRFMLPHFVWEDFGDVIDDSAECGVAIRKEWFLPFFEFRFPLYGAIGVRGMELELRMALEPWHVLGEQVGAQSTARYVDSSVERLQVVVNGWSEHRYVLACNGRRVPLVATGKSGEYVAGVRYKAWQPPSGLHPTIAVHAPLVFDLIDAWNARSVGGCTYHVAHPGGRNSDRFPVNAGEAEARRRARFWTHGHTPGPMSVPPVESSPEYPFTLDLRYPAAR